MNSATSRNTNIRWGFLVTLNEAVKYYPIFYKILHYFFLFSISPTTDMPQIAGVLVCIHFLVCKLPATCSERALWHQQDSPFLFHRALWPWCITIPKGNLNSYRGWGAGRTDIRGGENKRHPSFLEIPVHVTPPHFFIWGSSSFGNYFGHCVCFEYEIFLWFFLFSVFKNRAETGTLHLGIKKHQTETFHIWGYFVSSYFTCFYNKTLIKILLWNTSSFIYSHGWVISRTWTISLSRKWIGELYYARRYSILQHILEQPMFSQTHAHTCAQTTPSP